MVEWAERMVEEHLRSQLVGEVVRTVVEEGREVRRNLAGAGELHMVAGTAVEVVRHSLAEELESHMVVVEEDTAAAEAGIVLADRMAVVEEGIVHIVVEEEHRNPAGEEERHMVAGIDLAVVGHTAEEEEVVRREVEENLFVSSAHAFPAQDDYLRP